jgi:murein DD-endopeptidase MepM/ murein hydrolase activator NlpD
VILRNPVEGPRIVPFGQPVLSTDKLPNGFRSFRVTQTFDNIDAYWQSQHPGATATQLASAPRHRAIDLGNTRCGDKVLAALAGKAITGRDSAGALYVIVDHGNGWVTRYWHLDGWTIPQGVWVAVAAGQQIGIVGDTGLGAICHLHFEAAYQGVKQDPWKLLAQNLGADVAPVIARDVMFDVVPQRWTVSNPAGAVVYDAPNGAPTGQRLALNLPIKTIGEPIGVYGWRVVLVSPAPGSRKAAYVKRADLDDEPRDPALEDAVWAILTTHKMPTGGFTAAQVQAAREEAGARVASAASGESGRIAAEA